MYFTKQGRQIHRIFFTALSLSFFLLSSTTIPAVLANSAPAQNTAINSPASVSTAAPPTAAQQTTGTEKTVANSSTTIVPTLKPQPSLNEIHAEQQQGYLLLPPYKEPDKPTAIDKKLLSVMGEYNLVGLAAAVFQNDKIIWSNGYGWADLRSRREVNPNTIFRAASISKMITATALLQLYEAGKFQLDDDISQYLGYTVRNPLYPKDKITFRHLLTHTSSIIDSGSYDKMVENNPALLTSLNLRDLLSADGSLYAADNFAPSRPGESFNYANLGTGLIGSLVEVISGERFENYCLNHIFRPLQLDAAFDPADLKNWQNLAVIYRPDPYSFLFAPKKDDYNGIKPKPLLITSPLGSALGWSPAGSARISITDLSKFMLSRLNGGSYNGTKILKKETVDLMNQLHWYGDAMDHFYKQKGLNIHVSDDLVPGQRLYGHAAEAYGLIGDTYYDPDSKFGLAFFINGGDYTDSNPYYKVENLVAQALFTEFAPKITPDARKITGKSNSTVLQVNDRQIIMSVPAMQKGETSFFVPELAAADALQATITLAKDTTGATPANTGTTTLTYSYKGKTAVLVSGKAEIKVNGKITPLPVAPYISKEHIMVPLRELGQALGLKANYDLH